MVKRNNNNLSGLSSVARSTGEFLYQWPLVYTFSCCIVLAQGLEFTRMNSVLFLSTSCGSDVLFCPKINEDAVINKPKTEHTIIWPLRYWFRCPHLRCCCCHCVVKPERMRWKCWLKLWVIFEILSGSVRTGLAELWKEMSIQWS